MARPPLPTLRASVLVSPKRSLPTRSTGMAQAPTEVVKVEKYNGVTTVVMNRPQKRNAMNPALHEAMDRILAELETDPDTKVVVIRGAGGNFSAGQGLKEVFRENEDK